MTCLVGGPGRRREAAVVLQDRDTFGDALVTDMSGHAGHKTSDVGGRSVAE
jgi:hypothetical protein